MTSFRAWLARLFSIGILGLAGLVALASVAAHGGRVNWLLDVIAAFAPVLLGASLVVLLLALLVGRWARGPAIALAATGIVASGALMAPEFLRGSGPKAPASASRPLKIVQFNMLRTNTDIEAIVDWLVAQDPDIVTMQEARHDLRDALVARTGWRLAGAAGDLMIFSRQPRIVMHRPMMGEETPLHWVNATYPSDSGPYEVVTLHLDWPSGPSQAAQWADLASLVRQLPTRRMILAGDFNATPWAATLQRGERALPLIRRDRALASFPAKWLPDGPIRSPIPILPIDHVYAGPGWATVKVERGPPTLGSDHRPLIVTLAPVGPP
jgi:endonuclease/exonuclease/phosphatase (EEP) superfamily protein YafD